LEKAKLPVHWISYKSIIKNKIIFHTNIKKIMVYKQMWNKEKKEVSFHDVSEPFCDPTDIVYRIRYVDYMTEGSVSTNQIPLFESVATISTNEIPAFDYFATNHIFY